jgi:pyruvate,water dikinase
VDRPGLGDEALAEHYAATIALQAHALEVHFRVHAVVTAALAELRHTAREVLGEDADPLALLRGRAPTLLEVPASLDRLARLAGADDRVRALVARGLRDGLGPACRPGEDGPEVTAFLAALDDHLERHGHRTPGYELLHPTAAEDPATVLRAVQARLDLGGVTPAGRRPAVVPDAVRGVGRERLEHAVARAAAAYPLREESGPVTWTEPLAVVRYAALEIGRRGHARGLLDAPEDVFWLDHDEVRAVAAGAGPGRDVPGRRRHAAVLAEATTPPPTLGQNPGQPRTDDLPEPARRLNEGLVWLVGRMLEPGRLAARAEPDHDVAGVGVARGRAAGTVRVVRHDRDLERVRPGDVLVCPAVAAAWTVVLPTVAAVVTDSGGTLSHSAIMAREFGVPAVAATGDASRVLTDGRVVEVDGDAGLVRVRESTAAPR